MNANLKKVIRYFLVLSLTLVLLYLAFRKIDWNEFAKELKSCNYWWIFAAMMTGFVDTLARGFRWRLMLLPIDPKLKRIDCYNAYAVCYLANLAFTRSGEVVRCGMITDNSKVSFKDAMGSMVLERAWDVAVSFIIAIAMVFLTDFGDFIVIKIWKPFIESMSDKTMWLLLAFLFVFAVSVITAIGNKNRIKRTKFGAMIVNFLKGMLNGVKAAFKMKHNGRFLIFTIIIQFMYWVQVLCVIKAFPAVSHLDGMDALFIMIVGLLGWIVPVQGGFGAYHVLVTMALVPVCGLDQQTALIFATISHESQVAQMIILGLIALLTVAYLKRKRINKQTL